jgi:hypothetical protein
MIKLLNILKEIGEASITPYEYDYDRSKHKAFFTTEHGIKYIVYFDISKGEMKVDFGVRYEDDDDDENVDFEIITNKGNMYRIMSTIVSIIRKASSEFKPNQIKISANPQKIPLYKMYILKNLDEYILTKEDIYNLVLQRK